VIIESSPCGVRAAQCRLRACAFQLWKSKRRT
jgi:hypothetical protein